jgi:preprotein translocase subunit YajC
VKTTFHIGDRVTDSGGLSGTVVCVIETGEFSADYNAAEWAYLERGVMVMTEEAGLVHYPDCTRLAVSNQPIA